MNLNNLNWKAPFVMIFKELANLASKTGHTHTGAVGNEPKVLGTNIDSTGGSAGQALTAGTGGASSWTQKLGNGVNIVSELGGNYTSIASAIAGTGQRSVLLLNPHSTGIWAETGLQLKQYSKLKGYGTESFLAKVGDGDDIFLFDTNNYGAYLESLWLLTSGKGIVCNQYWEDIVLSHCKITASDIGTPDKPAIEANSHTEALYTTFTIDNNSYIYTSSASDTATINIICQATGLGQSWILKYSEIINSSDGPCIRVNAAVGTTVVIRIQHCDLSVGTGNYAIDKIGDGTLNIYISNVGYNSTDLVNPAYTGTVYVIDLNEHVYTGTLTASGDPAATYLIDNPFCNRSPKPYVVKVVSGEEKECYGSIQCSYVQSTRKIKLINVDTVSVDYKLIVS